MIGGDEAQLPVTNPLIAIVRGGFTRSYKSPSSRSASRVPGYGGTVIEYPWPEAPETTEARLRGLVESVLEPGELRSLRVDWVAPRSHRLSAEDAGWVALRILVVAGDGDDVFEREVWGSGRPGTWEQELHQLGSDLEDWVSESSFAWGQQRHYEMPDA